MTDGKMWITLTDTNLADSNTDGCILRNGFVTLREGALLFSPPNSSLDDWGSIALTNRGDLGMILKVKVGSSTFDGAFWNLLPVALKDQVVVAPPLGPNSTWVKMDVIKMNARNDMLVLGEIQNTAVTGTKEDVLMRYRLDNLGNILETTVLWTKGMDVPSFGTTVNGLGSSDHVLALNDRGDYFTVVFGQGVTGLMINSDLKVAQEGDPAPVPGRDWNTLSLPKVALNDRGSFVYSGALLPRFTNDPTYLIAKGNMDDVAGQQKFAQAGDILPAFSAVPLGNGSAAPILLGNNGDIFWRAQTASTSEDAFMRNFEPVIQLNRTIVLGNLVTRIEQGENALAISPNGRFLAARVDLQVVGSAVLMVDFGLVLELLSCNPNPGTLSLVSGQATIGKQMTLAMDDAQIAGALPRLLFSTQQRFASPGSACGATTPYGELMISTSNLLASLPLAPWDGTNASILPLNIPNSSSLVDLKLFVQGYFRDATHAAGEDIRLTNALQIEIGAP
ncbi:MAG: hypothetical protein EXS08_02630 [Planctomycetes bacterium]|nr:hypothetical protein [Planctomycetota bacterium]